MDYGTPLLTYGRFLNLEPAVAFDIQKSSGANTVEVVRRVKAELAEINEKKKLIGIEYRKLRDKNRITRREEKKAILAE